MCYQFNLQKIVYQMISITTINIIINDENMSNVFSEIFSSVTFTVDHWINRC